MSDNTSILHFAQIRASMIKKWRIQHWLICLIGIFICIGIDQYSKLLSVQYFYGSSLLYTEIVSGSTLPKEINNNIALIGNFISVDFALNKGIALGLPLYGKMRDFLTIFGILGICILFIFSISKPKIETEQIGYLLILGGALSNGYDRIIHGQVVDFISIQYFAICNIADFFISIGVILLLYHTIRNKNPEYAPRTRTSLT